MENNKPKNIEVQTFADDMARVIGDNQDGIIKKIVEENETREAEIIKTSPERKKNVIFLVISAILVVLAFGAILSVFIFRKEIFSVEVKPQYVSIIFTDNTQFKDISGFKKEQIVQTVFNDLDTTEVKSGGIEGIFLLNDKKIIGFRQFLDLIESNIDRTKIEFINDNFLIGIANKDTKNLFFLIQMRSVVDIFDVMRGWEEKMFLNLHGFFGVTLNVDSKYLLEKDFEDGIIQNKNARILYDKDRNIVMMYVYVEDGSMIITNNEKTTEEIITRLASAKVKK